MQGENHSDLEKKVHKELRKKPGILRRIAPILLCASAAATSLLSCSNRPEYQRKLYLDMEPAKYALLNHKTPPTKEADPEHMFDDNIHLDLPVPYSFQDNAEKIQNGSKQKKIFDFSARDIKTPRKKMIEINKEFNTILKYLNERQAYLRGDQIFVINSDGSKLKRLTDIIDRVDKEDKQEYTKHSILNFAISPKEEKIAYTLIRRLKYKVKPDPEIFIMDSDSSNFDGSTLVFQAGIYASHYCDKKSVENFAIRNLIFSPDDKYLAFKAGFDKKELKPFIVNLNSSKLKVLDTKNPLYIRWSSDGKNIMFYDKQKDKWFASDLEGKLRTLETKPEYLFYSQELVNALNSRIVKKALKEQKVHSIHAQYLSPDKKKIIFDFSEPGDTWKSGWQSDLIYVDSNKKVVRLTNDDTEENCIFWSPNNKQILFIKDESLYTINVNNVTTNKLFTNASSVKAAKWSNDGEKIYVIADDGQVTGIKVRPIQKKKFEKTKNYKKEFLFAAGMFSKNSITASKNGIYSKKGDKITLVTDESKYQITFSWAQDRKKIAFTAMEKQFDRMGRTKQIANIYSTNEDGSGKKKILENSTSPSWSPDNNKIAFLSEGKNKKTIDIFLANPDGSDKINLTNSEFTHEIGPLAWSPDGKRIAFAAFKDFNFDIYTIKKDGSECTRVLCSPENEYDPYWSRDGKQLVFKQGIENTSFYLTDIDKKTNAFSVIPAWHYYLVASQIKKDIENRNEQRFKRIFDSIKQDLYGPCIISPDGKAAISFLDMSSDKDFNKKAIGIYEINLEKDTKKLIKKVALFSKYIYQARLNKHTSQIKKLRQRKNWVKEQKKWIISNLDGSKIKTLEGLVQGDKGTSVDITWSPDEKQFIINQQYQDDNNSHWFSIGNNKLSHKKLSSHTNANLWSPDGKYFIIIESEAEGLGSTPTKISMYKSKDASLIASTQLPIQWCYPSACWSSDSKKLFFDSHSKKNYLYSWNINSTLPTKIKECEKMILAISSEGNYITRIDESEKVYYFLNFLDDSHPKVLGEYVSEGLLSWSPDGRKIAYTEKGFQGIIIYNLDTGKKEKVKNQKIPWSPRSDEIQLYQLGTHNQFLTNAYKSPKEKIIIGQEAILASEKTVNKWIFSHIKEKLRLKKRLHGGSWPVWRRD